MELKEHSLKVIGNINCVEKVILNIIADLPYERRSIILPQWYELKKEAEKADEQFIVQKIMRFVKLFDLHSSFINSPFIKKHIYNNDLSKM